MDSEYRIGWPQVAISGVGVGTGTAMMLGTPFYCLELAETREFQQLPHQNHQNTDLLLSGTLAFVAGMYLVHRSINRLSR
jgi:hypothetical protein